MEPTPTQQLAQRYDREAAAYRAWWAPVLQVAGRRLLEELKGCAPRRILDVGSGVGALLPDLQTAFPQATLVALDRSPGMLAQAPSEFPRAVMDGGRLAVADASVDLAVLAFMLFHLENPAGGVCEARRVLRAGGRFAAITWAGDLESPALQAWTDCLDEHDAPEAEPTQTANHELVDTPEKMIALARAAGFVSVRAWLEDLVYPIGASHLEQLRTQLGSSKPRFDGLAPEAQTACIRAARERWARLGPGDFVARGALVYTIAEA